MLTASFAFAVLCFLFLLVFFAGLPNLRTCELPSQGMMNEPGHKRDRLAVLIVTVLYAFTAFWNLGNTKSPQTFVPMAQNELLFELPENEVPGRLVFFPGVGQGEYSIEYSEDAEGWYPLTSFQQDHVAVLKWQFLSLELSSPVRYLRLLCTSGNPWLGEVVLQNHSGQPLQVNASISELTDEQNLVPDSSSFLNSSYFDEIYHARTAWEHLNGIWPYEISHPPLGKELLSIGIMLFGMSPFGWRFSGTVTGILMLPLTYLFLRRLFGAGRVSVLGTILMASGFMHYAQTRIATVDSYAVFFILLMYYFMYGWVREEKNLDLALCGFSFALGVACKWTCLYAGAGLAVIWFAHWMIKFSEDGVVILHRFFKNSLFCLVFFVAVPALIYYLSYIPYGKAEGSKLFSAPYTRLVLDNQRFMFNYHANIVAEHPYSSRWYQWILDIRPILYYLEYLPDGKRISIAAFVNPLVCWGGVLSLLVLLVMTVLRRDRTAAFLLVGYASGLVPWMFISRLTFEYHYFASAAFLILAICYVFALMENNCRKASYYITGFTVVSVLLFVLFFPVLNGIAVDNVLASKILGWLPSWPI